MRRAMGGASSSAASGTAARAARVAGRSVHTASPPARASHSAASGVNVNALLKDVAGKDLLDGTGRVALDVDTVGKSVGELRSHLHGTASLNLRDGAISLTPMPTPGRNVHRLLAV